MFSLLLRILLPCQVFGEKKDKRNIEKMELEPPETLSVTSTDRELLEQHRKVRAKRVLPVRVSLLGLMFPP